MEQLTTLGSTDLEVSRHGFGAARIGDGAPLEQIESLLDGLLDLGITFIDTADCYTASEELLGRFLGSRLREFAVATKCGCITGGAEGEPYSRAVIENSIDRSLKTNEPRASRSRLSAHLLGGGPARRRSDGGPPARSRCRQGALHGVQRRRRRCPGGDLVGGLRRPPGDLQHPQSAGPRRGPAGGREGGYGGRGQAPHRQRQTAAAGLAAIPRRPLLGSGARSVDGGGGLGRSPRMLPALHPVPPGHRLGHHRHDGPRPRP